VVVIAAGALMCITAFAFGGTHYFGHFVDAGSVAHAIGHTVGSVGATFFAVVLLNASLIGAGAVTLATSYVVGDVTGARGSLHRSFRQAKGFYTVFSAMILAAAGIVLIPGAPLGVITEAVQALCGILLPLTSVFLLMLCNDREVLGPWTNPPWLKAFASAVVGILMVLSLILTITTLFPSVSVNHLAEGGGIVLALALGASGVMALRGGARQPVAELRSDVPKEQWTMSPATLLTRPKWSRARQTAMLALGSYMVVALVLLIVKTVQLAGG
jgi:Natural resistance-associated macrophage protein